MSSPEAQREFAMDVVKRLRAAGYESLWAGGCVRDQLLGRMPKDYDVATNATPDEIRDLFGRRRTLPIGAAFGVVTVLGPRAAGQLDVVTFRTDSTYSDGRHPDSVMFSSAEQDAARRDFTINGMFYDPLDERVVDYVEGQADIARRLIRAIGDPRKRIREDKLRMLRAVRFAAAFGFAIESETLAAIRDLAAEVTTVSAERIGAEVRRMLLDANRAGAVKLLIETRLLPQVLPEIADLDHVAIEEICRQLERLNDPSLALALATILSARPSGASTETAGSPAHALGRRLRLTNREIERTDWLLRKLPEISQTESLPWPRLQRLLVHEGAEELVALRAAIAGDEDASVRQCLERLAWPAERLNPPPLVDGSDLIAHGLAPGPRFAALLEQVRDAQLEGEVSTRAEALAFVDRLR
jgi:tRNA nucleotidyltransferase/poly(A) polymerase